MGCVCFMYIKIELESVGTWWRQNAAIEVNPLVWMVIPVSDDKSIIKQVLPKRSVSTLLADDHDSLAPQNVSLIKKMQFLDKQRSMILNNFGTVSITSLSLIMAHRTRCITHSVRFLRFVDLLNRLWYAWSAC